MEILEKLQITDNGILEKELFVGDICWVFSISKEHRKKHPLGSWKNKQEEELIKYWHRKKLVIIRAVNRAKFPYPSSYAYTTLRTKKNGAWLYEDFLEYADHQRRFLHLIDNR